MKFYKALHSSTLRGGAEIIAVDLIRAIFLHKRFGAGINFFNFSTPCI